MLLAKLRESKNSNKENRKNLLISKFYIPILSLVVPSLQAQQDSSSFSHSESIVSVVLSLIVVIAIIFALAYMMRRFNVAQAGQGQLKVVASMMAGSKEKIMVIQVGEEQHLLGITTHNINHLAKLENTIAAPSQKLGSEPANNKASFQTKLLEALSNAKQKNSVDTARQGKKDDE